MPQGSGTSALVVLRPESGRLTGQEAVTAETLSRYRPDPDAAKAVLEFFEAAGFEVGPLVGLGFAISAPADLFDRVFGRSAPGEGHGGSDLPLTPVPEPLRDHVQAVTFPPPPDFGPTRW